MRKKDKARRRVSSPRSLKSPGTRIQFGELHPPDVLAMGKRILSDVHELEQHLIPVSKKPCSSMLLAHKECDEKLHRGYGTECSQHLVGTAQPQNMRKRKATQVYGPPKMPLEQGKMSLSETTYTDYTQQHSGSVLAATATKKTGTET